MKKIKKVLDLLQVNWRTMAEFEILYKVSDSEFSFLSPAQILQIKIEHSK